MYTPKLNQVTDRAVLIEAMRSYSFAILFGPQSAAEAVAPLAATHLPLVVKDEGQHGLLEGHFALANRHWQALGGRETLVVFCGPHSYVSPSLYTEPLSVPTWNYVAIHAYGTLSLIEDESGKEAVLAELIQAHEPGFADQWRTMPADFRHSMLAGIVGFRIPVTRIDGKFKISQNRNQAEQRNIHDAQVAGTADQKSLAAWMERLIK